MTEVYNPSEPEFSLGTPLSRGLVRCMQKWIVESTLRAQEKGKNNDERFLFILHNWSELGNERSHRFLQVLLESVKDTEPEPVGGDELDRRIMRTYVEEDLIELIAFLQARFTVAKSRSSNVTVITMLNDREAKLNRALSEAKKDTKNLHLN